MKEQVKNPDGTMTEFLRYAIMPTKRAKPRTAREVLGIYRDGRALMVHYLSSKKWITIDGNPIDVEAPDYWLDLPTILIEQLNKNIKL